MYKRSKIKKTSNTTKIGITIILIIVGLLFALLILELTNKTNLIGSREESITSNTDNQSGINLEPPTEQEEAAGNEQKNKLEEDSEKETPNSAEVVIVDASQYGDNVEVRAFVANIVQKGECKITFSKQDLSFSKIVMASADASTSPCITLTLPVSEFSVKGVWQVEVEYTGSNISGTTTTDMEIE